MQRSDLRAQGWKYHFCQLHRGGRYEPLTKQFKNNKLSGKRQKCVTSLMKVSVLTFLCQRVMNIHASNFSSGIETSMAGAVGQGWISPFCLFC